jgi:hypothetical protein
MLSISWPQPGPRVRAVIIVVIYLGTLRIAPHESIPLALGSVLGGLLAAGPACSPQLAGVRGVPDER